MRRRYISKSQFISNTFCSYDKANRSDPIREHIIIACELAGFSPAKTNNILNNHYNWLKEYTDIRPVILADMLDRLIDERQAAAQKKCLKKLLE